MKVKLSISIEDDKFTRIRKVMTKHRNRWRSKSHLIEQAIDQYLENEADS